MITKVTIKGMRQAVQMFGPAQAAVAKAVADSVEAGVIPKNKAEDYVIVCGVFIHPAAEDNKKIYDYNYEATKMAIASAMTGKPTVSSMRTPFTRPSPTMQSTLAPSCTSTPWARCSAS